MGRLPLLLLLLSHLAFLLITSSATAVLPLPKPSPYIPAKPPVHPPVQPPTKPPVHPPVKPPVYPPVKPPTKPPVHPPVKSPVHPPVKPPTKPPTYPPVKPPTKPPVTKPPTYPPVVKPPVSLKPVAVQGVVLCKNCSYPGIETFLGSKPLPGATVVLKCRTWKTILTKNATTDKNGYFFIEAPKGVISHKAFRYCHVNLVSPPAGAACKQITNINGGRLGGLLKLTKTLLPLPYDLFTVGPFAFQTPKRYCRHHKTEGRTPGPPELGY